MRPCDRSALGEPGAATLEPIRAPRSVDGRVLVLLVEDDAGVRRVTTAMLQRLGYDVVPTADPVEAREAAARHAGRLHLVCSDLMLPGQLGTALLDELAGRYPLLRGLLTTGHSAELARAAVARRRWPVLTKPYGMDQLADAVAEALTG